MEAKYITGSNEMLKRVNEVAQRDNLELWVKYLFQFKYVISMSLGHFMLDTVPPR